MPPRLCQNSSSKKSISANQLAPTLGCDLKTGWFIGHRLRETVKTVGFEPLGGPRLIVEADETHMGDKAVVTTRTKCGKSGHSSKRSVVALVERGGGRVRTFHVASAT